MLPEACEIGTEVELECRMALLRGCVALKLGPLQLIELGKKCLQLALEMTDLRCLQEIAFTIAQLCNTVNDKTRSIKRDNASLLYIATQ